MRLKPRQIESWMLALGLLDQRQGTTESENSLRDILKDGSILCRLVNRLKPGTINQVSEPLPVGGSEVCFASAVVNYACDY